MNPRPIVRTLAAVAALTAGRALAQDARPDGISEYQILKSFTPDQQALFGSGVPDSQGLTGTNHHIGSWVEAGPQRGACRQVLMAVVRGDLASADAAWRGIDVAFSHQQADGRFEAAIRPNGASARPLGAAVETSFFFLQDLGRALLVIQESPYESHFHRRIVAITPKVRLACAFISGGYATIIENSSKAVNRIVLAAKAFGTCGEFLHDPALIATSHRLVRHALTLRDSDGVFIENGGRDSSYNMVSILYGQLLALHVAVPELEAAFGPAVRWELTRIAPDGRVEVGSNSRTGVGKEFSYQGEPKNVNYPEVAAGLLLYGAIHHVPEAVAASDRVRTYLEHHHE